LPDDEVPFAVFLAQKHGVNKAGRALGVVAGCAAWIEMYGEMPPLPGRVFQLGQEVKPTRSRRSMYRDLAVFREVFGDYSPEMYARHLLAEMKRRKVSKKDRRDQEIVAFWLSSLPVSVFSERGPM
jgi:hypothetical protein